MPDPSGTGGSARVTVEDIDELLNEERQRTARARRSETHSPSSYTGRAHSDEEMRRMAAELVSEGIPRFLSLDPWVRLEEMLVRMRENKE